MNPNQHKAETMGEEYRQRAQNTDSNQWYFDEYSGLYRQNSHTSLQQLQQEPLSRSVSASQLSTYSHPSSHKRHVSCSAHHDDNRQKGITHSNSQLSLSSTTGSSLPRPSTRDQHQQPQPQYPTHQAAPTTHPFPWPESVERIHGWCTLARKSKDPTSQLKLCRRFLATLAEEEANYTHEQARSIINNRHHQRRQTEGAAMTKPARAPEREHIRQVMMLECLRTLKRLSAGQGLGKGGDSEAQFILANCYGIGLLGLVEDHSKAFQWYVQASKQAHPEATYRTAVCHELGIGTRKDGQRAMVFYRKAAHLAHVGSMYKLGIILLRGYYHMTPLPREAISWLQRAASHVAASPSLAPRSGTTTNTTSSVSTSASSSVSSSSSPSVISSACLPSAMSSSSFPYITATSGPQAPHALHALAMIQLTGEVGDATSLIADPAYAMELLHQAAAQGNYMPSQVQLGHCYEHGQWAAMDDALSIYWYARAAEQGSPEGCLALSGWYLTGSAGVMLASDREAYLWARRAATSNVQASDPWTVAKAHFAVAIYSERGIGVDQVDKDKARRWMIKAAAMGHAGAKQCLKAREAAEKKSSQDGTRAEKVTGQPMDENAVESKCLIM